MTPFHRAAIYFMPSVTTPLGRFGAGWLGRDAEGGPVAARPPVPGLDDAALHRLTAEPRRYGFHATLRAPFVAADGLDAEGLVTAIARLAATLAPVTLDGGLSVRRIGSFLALVPASPSSALTDLAAAIVAGTDDLRRPLSADDRARRIARGRLDARHSALLDRWGYPYVMDAFRFHMTLTGPLTDMAGVEAVEQALPGLARQAGATGTAVAIDRIAIAVEPAPGAPFVLYDHYPLGDRASL